MNLMYGIMYGQRNGRTSYIRREGQSNEKEMNLIHGLMYGQMDRRIQQGRKKRIIVMYGQDRLYKEGSAE